ncbi:VOC family protein [Angustibacter sp. McL0619]|uniref:VOC family protein n=1 Tax=Angustibacter sp. McL0619 TaxID=3415676 RepID=UPI003CF8FA48
MSTHETPWPTGTPCWVELSSDDPAAANAFYSGLFGWDVQVAGPEFGGYGVARVDGHRVAGIGGKMGDGDQPTAWTTYLASDDVDATAAAVAQHGGQVLAPPMDVGDLGRMIIGLDPAGASFGVWQSGSNTGVGLVNQPGGVVWNEHTSNDFAAAKSFYSAVFGLRVESMEGAPADLEYAVLARSGGQMVGSLGKTGIGTSLDDPPNWLIYFGVADADATAAKAVELGGAVLEGPRESAYGQLAVVAGPEGEHFVVVQTAPEGYGHSDGPDAQSID